MRTGNLKIKSLSFLLALLFILPGGWLQEVFAQVQTRTSAGYEFQVVEGDPLKARKYQLENGLTVFLSVNKSEPRIHTFIGVRAGSKTDPSDATGLAHYLEHMLFKGTDEFGTLNYRKEQKLLKKIEKEYENYRSTKDEASRKEIYAKIDKLSGKAAKYAIANEYDKMLSAIGAEGTNAWTSFEQTVYTNEIPANQLEQWLYIEGERFKDPVFRIFHTELEAVYEEKNRSLDSDNSSAFQTVLEALFPTHNYGQQTTIGTIDHLKNPSITKIRAYFEKNYVPNNMCISMSGDLDPDKTIALIDKYFGWMKPREVTEPEFPAQPEIMAPIEEEVWGPDAEFLIMAYRMPGANTPESDLLTLCDMILANSSAGLIDLNLNKQQKVLRAGSFVMELNDYSAHFLNAQPREGQQLEEVRDLLLEQIEKLKSGDFDEGLMEAIINNMETEEMRSYQNNFARANTMLDAFIRGNEWENVVQRIRRLRELPKDAVVDFAKKHYQQNFVICYKRTGEKKDLVKVEKPAITPVEVNREAQSPFLKKVINWEAKEISPKFLDFQEDIEKFRLKNGIPVHYVKNNENQLFTLAIVFPFGRLHDKKMDFALQYLPYLGTELLSSEEIQKRFYTMGIEFNVRSGDRKSYVIITGLEQNLASGLQLFEELIKNAAPDEEALQKMNEGELKDREDRKLNKRVILRSGMVNYAMHGEQNPFNDILTREELDSLKAEELTGILHGLLNYKHEMDYYGSHEKSTLKEMLQGIHQAPMNLKNGPVMDSLVFKATIKPKVIFVHYDMVQAEVMWLYKGPQFDADLMPRVRVFNEYYGGNMASIVFQTLRESKALAYSTWCDYDRPGYAGEPFYLKAYIGTQADKITEAMDGMIELLNEMPEAGNLFSGAKEAIRNQIRTQRINREQILFARIDAEDMEMDHEIRQDVFEKLDEINIDKIKAFHEKFVADKPCTILVLGSREKVDLKSLEKYGEVKEVSLKTIFGY